MHGAFSTGDGSTTFRVPDLRGIFVRGIDDGANIDAGRTIGSEQLDALQNITGTFSSVFYSNTGCNNTLGGAFSGTPNGAMNGGGSMTTNYDAVVFDASKVARTSTETRPINIALLACIKY